MALYLPMCCAFHDSTLGSGDRSLPLLTLMPCLPRETTLELSPVFDEPASQEFLSLATVWIYSAEEDEPACCVLEHSPGWEVDEPLP